MSQHPVDLLPDSIRARAQAGIVLGRSIAALVLAVLIVVVLTTHARLRLQAAREQMSLAEADANLVLEAEATQAQLRQQLTAHETFVNRYARAALPLSVSQLLATVVNQLPVSAALDRIDLEAEVRKAGPGSRHGGGPKPAETAEGDVRPPRILSGEVAGFTATDQEIAELVARLEAASLFRDVKLDYSRTRSVRDRSAREFRVSFKVDLDCRYVAAAQPSAESGGDAALGAQRAAPATGPRLPSPSEHADANE